MTLLDTASEQVLPTDGEIAVAAASLIDAHDDAAELVIVARVDRGGHRALGSTNGPLRAAVSVAVAAGNARLWDGATGNCTVHHQVRDLPEIVRSAAEAAGVIAVHVGAVVDDDLAAVAVWFDRHGAASNRPARTHVLELLTAAAQRQRDRIELERAERVEDTTAAAEDTEPGIRVFDASDPDLDADTGLATEERFEEALAAFEGDEATLVVVDLDDFATVAKEHGGEVSRMVLRTMADRLLASCRRDDVVARVGTDTFAILFADATRAVGLTVAKRLLTVLAEPLEIDGGPDRVTATIALAHQFGLVDMDELLESADDAVASGKRAGRGRLVVAS